MAAAIPAARRGGGAALRASRAVFIDKDGTLVRDVPYNADPAKIALAPRAAAALRALRATGFRLYVVTNQPGLALGRFTRTQFDAYLAALTRVLADQGAALDGVFACPHAPGADGRPACDCRKPAPGLLRQAALRDGVDLAASWMVGDILDDVEAGRRAGARTVLLDVGHETEWRRGRFRTPTVTVTDWDGVCTAILAATVQAAERQEAMA
jgi:histidinol-phosphate phosphatase family protein